MSATHNRIIKSVSNVNCTDLTGKGLCEKADTKAKANNKHGAPFVLHTFCCM